ncbi:MAG: hypothetical protein P8X74_18635 [Reinekea sp.]
MTQDTIATISDNKDTLNVQTAAENPQTLRDSVEIAMRNYFDHLDGQDVTNVHQMVLTEVEAPMLEAVMLRSPLSSLRHPKLTTYTVYTASRTL